VLLPVRSHRPVIPRQIVDGGGSRRRLYFVAPDGPSGPRLPREEFDLRQSGIHRLNEFVGFVGFAAVFSAGRGND
jgi:hypothetical protein